jgi:hypothetical protein
VVRRLSDRPLWVIVLWPSPETVGDREALRAKTAYGAWTVDGLDWVLRTETPRVGLWLDTSGLTPAETVDTLVVRIADAQITP